MKAALVLLFIVGASIEYAHGATASVYCEPQRIACGRGMFNPHGMTVAHKTLPCGTVVQIDYKGRSVTATVNDRGPYVRGRDVDLSCGVAHALKFPGLGHVEMKVVSLGRKKHHRKTHG